MLFLLSVTWNMGIGFKHSGWNPNRGFKQIASAAKRGVKFVKQLPQTIATSDALARKAANTLRDMGDYAMLGSSAIGHEGLGGVGHALHGLGQSIHEFRRSDFANRLRNDFQSKPSIMDAPSS